MVTMYETEYLSCAETAKLLRQRLKDRFPQTRFSVRSKTYSGGASIDVSWTDGPTEREFNAVAQIFASKDFDGMIDMAVSTYAWMAPDGTITFAGTPGTQGSMGVIPRSVAPRPVAEAKRVHFGSHYVSGSRHYSQAFLETIALQEANKYGRPIPPVLVSGFGAYVADDWGAIVDGRYTLPQIINREAHQTSAL